MGKVNNSKYILSVTFGDYKNTCGGVAKVVSTHQRMFNKNGISYICIFPYSLSNRIYVKHNKYWGLIVDGVFENVYSTKMLITFLANLSDRGFFCECIHIHHLLHIDMLELSKLICCTNANIFFYIHDYYTICCSTKLIGDDGILCRNDFLNTERCRTCSYYEDSIAFRSDFEKFVEYFKTRLKFICPSDACKKWFLKQYNKFSDNVIIVYHQIFSGEYNIPRNNNTNKIKIGYVGAPVPAKGWNHFKELYEKFYNNEKYEFVYFSSTIDDSVDIRNVPVSFQLSLTAMQDALRHEKVDYVVLWSNWPETYSYTYYESYSAGCCILTNKDSGNMADQVGKMHSGLVLSDRELLDFFDDFENVKNFRDSYIINKKSVFLLLIENDAIVNMSDGQPYIIESIESDIKNVKHEQMNANILKFAYKTKIWIRKQG